jgi:hypothetical protein
MVYMVYNKWDVEKLSHQLADNIKRLSLYIIAVKLGFGKPLGAGQICSIKLGFVITGLYNEMIIWDKK